MSNSPQNGLTDLDYFRTFTSLTHRTVGYLDSASPTREGYRRRLEQHAAWLAAELERTEEDHDDN